jgi:hypothetical protein
MAEMASQFQGELGSFEKFDFTGDAFAANSRLNVFIDAGLLDPPCRKRKLEEQLLRSSYANLHFFDQTGVPAWGELESPIY